MLGPILLLALTAELVPVADTRCDGVLRAERDDGSVVAQATLPATRLTVDDGTPVTIRLVSQQCWAPELRVTAPPTEPLRISAWPRGSLSGEVDVPPGATVPPELQLHIESPAGPRAEIHCPVAERRWTCGVPRIPLDVRIVAGDFVPLYFWDVQPDRSLGTLRFERGASISGWVVDGGEDRASGAATVTLAPQAFKADARVAKQTQTVQTNARGFFQFRGVATGESYTITARRSGRAPATASEIRVDRETEYALERPLELGVLGSLEWTITPHRPLTGGEWRVSVHRRVSADGTLAEVRGVKSFPDGTWRVDGLEPGEYRIAVADAAGTTYHREYLDVDDRIARSDIRLSLVPVRGTVRVGDDPLAALITFESEGRKARMRSEEDGAFAGSLPAEGEWLVRVVPENAQYRTARRKLEIARDAASGVAEVEIELPATYISGTVVDERGRPVVGAHVEVRRKGHYETNSVTDREGVFELAGMDEGSITLRAVTDDAESALTPFVVSEEDTSPVTLIVKRRQVVRGVVRRRNGRTVAGALIRHLGPTGQMLEASSGPGGEFALETAPGTAAVDVAVLAPGFPVKLHTIPVGRPHIEIVVEETRGVLQIRMDSPPWPFIARNGRRFILPMLLAPRTSGPPREMTGDGFAFELEPGLYEVCVVASDCRAVTVYPGGVAESDARGKTPKGGTTG